MSLERCTCVSYFCFCIICIYEGSRHSNDSSVFLNLVSNARTLSRWIITLKEYEPQFWWWEITVIFKKMMLTGAVSYSEILVVFDSRVALHRVN